jgi:hypothetical protein
MDTVALFFGDASVAEVAGDHDGSADGDAVNQ